DSQGCETQLEIDMPVVMDAGVFLDRLRVARRSEPCPDRIGSLQPGMRRGHHRRKLSFRQPRPGKGTMPDLADERDLVAPPDQASGQGQVLGRYGVLNGGR